MSSATCAWLRLHRGEVFCVSLPPSFMTFCVFGRLLKRLQAVLEGLNALLDHRAEVFIPELGASYHCHPQFRLFGAQNPLQVGDPGSVEEGRGPGCIWGGTRDCGRGRRGEGAWVCMRGARECGRRGG